MNDIGWEELDYLYRQYDKMPDGKEQAEAIRYAIKRSDELGIHEWRLANRHNLLYELSLIGEEEKIFPIISEFISIFEEKPVEKFVSSYLYKHYRALWIWDSLWHLPLEERKKIADRFFEVCKQYNANLFAYYDKEYEQFLKEGKQEEAKNYRKNALDALKRPYKYEISSCKACLQARKVEYAVDDKDWETAIKRAKPMLNGNLKCNHHPEQTIELLLNFAFDSGDWEKCEYYGTLLEQYAQPKWDRHIWYGMHYYAFVDLEKGLTIFSREFAYVLQMQEQQKKMEFYKYAYVLWTQYAKKHDSVSLELPKTVSLYQEDGVYQPTELAEWFYEKAIGIAKRFDERNGYPYFQNKIQDMIEGMKKMEKEK